MAGVMSLLADASPSDGLTSLLAQASTTLLDYLALQTQARMCRSFSLHIHRGLESHGNVLSEVPSQSYTFVAACLP